jgi:hypothetical protein
MTEVTKMFSCGPDHQAIIDECWSKRGDQRRFTVPKTIKLKLCKLAIAHVTEQQRQMQDEGPKIEASLRRAKSAAEIELKRRGWTDDEIAGWFKKLSERARKRTEKEFKKPRVDQVFESVTRRAPASTLRRKARVPPR